MLVFAGTVPAGGLASAVVAQWLFKSVYEAVVTPLTYVVVNFLKQEGGVDIYDHATRFNPLMMDS